MGHHHGTLDQLREPTKSLRRAVPDTWGAFVALHDQGSAEGVTLGVRPVVRATLAADHRASDGHDGGRFLAAVDRLLQKPETPKPRSADFFAALHVETSIDVPEHDYSRLGTRNDFIAT